MKDSKNTHFTLKKNTYNIQELLFDGLELNQGIEKQLFSAADKLRANSSLKAHEYVSPVLGLLFLKYLSNRFDFFTPKVDKEMSEISERNLTTKEDKYKELCGFYIPPNAHFKHLSDGTYIDILEENSNDSSNVLASAISQMVGKIEKVNPKFKGIFPQNEYAKVSKDTLDELIKIFNTISFQKDDDVFGRVYEYFLNQFALKEGQKGGQFFTPLSVVQLIVEILEPYKGSILDPACGSGGMFVQSIKFSQRANKKNANSLIIYGIEKIKETANLAKMHLELHGMQPNIKKINTFHYKELDAEYKGKYDFVMANPPFNVKDASTRVAENLSVFNQYGLPNIKITKSKKQIDDKIGVFGNANYLWASLFATALNEKGRAGFVMPNSAADARNAELEIRQNIVNDGIVDVIVAIASNFFYTVTLPATLWFYDKAKAKTDRKNKTLFIDARNTYTQVTRAVHTFTKCQMYNLTAIVWLYRGQTDKFEALKKHYEDCLDAWKNKTIEQDTKDKNGIDSTIKYEGIAKATAEYDTANLALQKSLNEWYNSIKAKINNEKTLKAIEEQQFESKIKQEKPNFEGLKALTEFANKTIRPKKDQTFLKTDIRIHFYEAQNAADKLQYIKKRIQYFESQIAWLNKYFENGTYKDNEGLCKIASIDEIAEQNYSLNPGRYVGVAIEEDETTRRLTTIPRRNMQALQQTKNTNVISSRFHQNQETTDFVQQFDEPCLVTMGSSLKFMLLAQGNADVYPRFAPTMEWDTAASDAILRTLTSGIYQCNAANEATIPLEYNKSSLLNPFFIAI